MKPQVNRDLLIVLGERGLFQKQMLDFCCFKLFLFNETTRQAALKRISKYRTLNIDNGYVQFCNECDDESAEQIRSKSLYIDLKHENGVFMLNYILENVIELFDPFFVKELCISSLCKINAKHIRLLLRALKRLRGIMKLCFPSESEFFETALAPRFRTLVGRNADSLQVVKNLTSVEQLPSQMMTNLSVVSNVALRMGGTEKTLHFLAFYCRGHGTTKQRELEGNLVVRINGHMSQAIFEPFEEKTFISERATSLELRLFSVYTNRKVNEVMDELTKFFEHWPSMKHVDITFVHPEGDPRLAFWNQEAEDLTPQSIDTVEDMSWSCINWLRSTFPLPYSINICVEHSIEYMCGHGEDVDAVQKRASEKAKSCFRLFKVQNTLSEKTNLPISNLFYKTHVIDNRHFELEVHFQMLTILFSDSIDDLGLIRSDRNSCI